MYRKIPQHFKVILTLIAISVLVVGLTLYVTTFERATAYAQGSGPTSTPTPTPTATPTPCSLVDNMPISVPDTLEPLCIDDQVQTFEFTAKNGKVYEISTQANPANVDTYLSLYRATDLENPVQTNDDIDGDNLNSKIVYQAFDDDTYVIRVENKSSVRGTYTLDAKLIELTPTATNTPGATTTPEARIEFDDYEDNYDFDTAYVIAADSDLEATETVYSLNFVPVSGEGPDNDFFKLWVKTGGTYTCATSNLSSYNDTNMIIYDQNRNGLAGNDDEAVGVLSSKVTYHATYTGWLYVLVGPNVEVNYNVSDQYEYDLNCTSSFAPPTAIPQPTSLPPPPPSQAQTAATPGAAPEVGGGVATIMPDSQQIASLDEAARQIIITPLETIVAPAAPAAGSFAVTIHRAPADAAENNPEGVGNMPVALYDAGGDLLAFGFTNTQGDLAVDIVSAGSEINVVIPYLGLREVVTYPETRFLEITLPPLEMNEEEGQ